MSEYIAIVSDSELRHHGVKGMKWGVRKQPEVSNTVRRRAPSGDSDPRKKTMSGKKKAALIIGGTVLAAAAITAAVVIARKKKGMNAVSNILGTGAKISRADKSVLKDIQTWETSKEERWSKDYFRDGTFVERLADGTVREGRWK